ncbi:MAG: CRISPR-associated helicase Cas3' [Acidobacteriota bacterium]|nr:CRISPR-associated helicase Cas3' [Acidobacteriota bacterium]
MNKILLAKSKKKGSFLDGCLLTVHTSDVVLAVESLLKVEADDIKRFFKLSDEQMKNLRVIVQLAAIWHDIGKANDGFQNAVRHKGAKQYIRHEHLSAILMSLDDVREWLSKSPDVTDDVFQIARLIVAGHHLQLLGEAKIKWIPLFAHPLNGDIPFVVHSNYDNFKELLARLCAPPFELKPLAFKIPTEWHFERTGAGESVRVWRERIKKEFEDFEERLSDEKLLLRLLQASRTVLTAADAAASGLRRVDGKQGDKWSPATWLEAALRQGSTPKSIQKIITKRKWEVRKVRRAAGEKFIFKEEKFQTEASTLGERALLLMPCGSGKTLAAYKWIQAQLALLSPAKAIFLYPTTGTATEGFKDYASHDPKAGNVHSRAVFDLTDMFTNPDDERSKQSYTSERKQRLFAIGFWGDTIFSATADAFLGFMQNSYSSLCLLPVLARSVVVIDEIHSFDDAMFSALLEFLKNFDLPVLMMTASLQRDRLRKLEMEVKNLRVYPREGDAYLDEVQKSGNKPRYRIRRHEEAQLDSKDVPLETSDLIKRARDAYHDNRKVLWVVNTVDRCILIAQMLKDVDALCYHSRFMYEHRRQQHNKVVLKFKDSQTQRIVAVTTQVCEMSLDLDADVLITEVAPAPSLIQRMGRCNRQREPRSLNKSGEVHIYRSLTSSLPYEENLFETGEKLLDTLEKSSGLEDVSQTQLADALKKMPIEKPPWVGCSFTAPTWEAYSLPLRETDDYAVSAVLKSRLPSFLKLQRERQPTTGLILQAPYRFTETVEGSWVRVVDDEQTPLRFDYCENYGLRERQG